MEPRERSEAERAEEVPLLLRGDDALTENKARRNGLKIVVSGGVMLLVLLLVSGDTAKMNPPKSFGDGVAVQSNAHRHHRSKASVEVSSKSNKTTASSSSLGTSSSPSSSPTSTPPPVTPLPPPATVNGLLELSNVETSVVPRGPFVAMEGMFEYERWKKLMFQEELSGTGSLHQMLHNYGASVSWKAIHRVVSTGLGAKGGRKLFLLVRHANAVHNAWGAAQGRVGHVKLESLPCDYKKPRDLVDPELTAVGKRSVKDYLYDVLKGGLAEKIHRKVIAFSSPLTRCMMTSQIMFANNSEVELTGGQVIVSELLRERIDPRVPFETRRPVSFVPENTLTDDEEAEVTPDTLNSGNNSGEVDNAQLGAGKGGNKGKREAKVGSNETDVSCFIPSAGLYGHPGDCCISSGLTQIFGTGFDINVTRVNDTDGRGSGCTLDEVAKLGWQKCNGATMLGLLAEDDRVLPLNGEETGDSVVQRVRAWFASVFDEVDDKVVIAVTHSDWISTAMRDLGIDKTWFVPRNSEIIPVIVEDTRPRSSQRASSMN